MQVWRLQAKTDGGDVSEYCINNGLIAMGWRLDDESREKLKIDCSFNHYCKLAELQYGNLQKWGSVKRMVEDTQVNDIVWMRCNGEYYFARVNESSDWHFDFSEEAVNLDVTNQITNVSWIKAGGEASVPGCVTTGFIKGSTYQKINKSGIIEYSQFLYNQLSKDDFKYDSPEIRLNERNFWNLLLPDDAEDLLCMWLYKEKGYIVIPSTNKKGTQLYECVLVDPNSEIPCKIYVQVKKGMVNIDASQYKDLNGEVYLMTTEGQVTNTEDSKCNVIDSTMIYNFAIDSQNISVIPESISRWIKFLADAENIDCNNRDTKGIIFDTNLSYSDTNELDMINNARVCAYGDAARYIHSFRKGDYALLYSKGRGIIAIGKVISDVSKQVEGEKGLYHDLEFVVPQKGTIDYRDKFISTKEIKSLLKRDFYWPSTMKVPFINEKQVEILTHALEEKYK